MEIRRLARQLRAVAGGVATVENLIERKAIDFDLREGEGYFKTVSHGSGKTLERNLSLLNSIGSFTEIMIQRADWPVGITSKTALQGFGRRTFRPFSGQVISLAEG